MKRARVTGRRVVIIAVGQAVGEKFKQQKCPSSSEDENNNAKKPEQENAAADCNNQNQSLEMADWRKKLLLSKNNPFPEAAPGTRTQVLTTPRDAESLELFCPLTEYKLMHERDPDNPRLVQHWPFFRRALFTVGLLLRHFDFTDEEVII
jgi:hypothetical protein